MVVCVHDLSKYDKIINIPLSTVIADNPANFCIASFADKPGALK